MNMQHSKPLHPVGVAARRHGRAGAFALETVGILLFLLFMTPFLMVLLNSAKTAKEIIYSPVSLPTNWSQIFTNIKTIFDNPSTDYLGAFVDSVIITVLSLAVITLFSSMCAWALVRNKKKWSTVIFMCFVAAMVIPFQVVMFPLVKWFKLVGDAIHIPLLGTYHGIVFAYLGFGCSMSVFILHGFIKNIPLELEEAATIDGCSQTRTFFGIVLPLLLLGSNGKVQTLPLAVTSFAGSYVKQWDLILTSALLAMLPIIVLFIFAQRYIIKGMVEGSIK